VPGPRPVALSANSSLAAFGAILASSLFLSFGSVFLFAFVFVLPSFLLPDFFFAYFSGFCFFICVLCDNRGRDRVRPYCFNPAKGYFEHRDEQQQ
jgi:hypothetical protein